MTYLSVRGSEFVLDDKPIRLRSVGLGSWLNLEHFMLGIPGTDAEIRAVIDRRFGASRAAAFWDRFYRVYVDDADIAFVRGLGLNSVRIPFNFRRVVDRRNRFDPESVAVREIDRILDECRRHGVWAILDLHAAPGGQNPDWHSDNLSGKAGFWLEQTKMDDVAILWGDLAAYYGDEPVVGGFDIINEPCYFDGALDRTLVAFSEACIDRIRRVDSRHTIFIEGNTYSRDFSMFEKNLCDNVAYTFHYYPFLQLPDGLGEPGQKRRISDSLWQDVTLSRLQEVLKRPIWCGETGHPLHAEETIGALFDFLEILEGAGISWALWPLKDARAMGLVFPTARDPWMRFVEQTTQRWSFFDSFTMDSILSQEGSDDRGAFYRMLSHRSSEANRLFEARLTDVSFDDMMRAVDGFAFERCELNTPLVERLRRILSSVR